MIYLSFSEQHLLCTVWSVNEAKTLLTQIVQIPLPGDLGSARDEETFNLILANAFNSLADQVEINSHEVLLTVPNYWSHRDFTAVDQEMSNEDIWNFILWQKNQRYGEKSNNYFTFCESNQSNIYHVVHIPNIYVTTLKLSVNELGGIASWLGTESMTFTGTKTSTFGVCYQLGTSYDLYVINRQALYTGTVRLIKGKWNVTNAFGFKDQLEALLNAGKSSVNQFLTQIYCLDRLSPKREYHWVGFKFKYIKPFAHAPNEGMLAVDNLSDRLLSIQSILADERFQRSGINFFKDEGICEVKQQSNVELQSEQKKKQSPMPTMKKSPGTKKPKKFRKNRIQTISQNFVRTLTIIIFLVTIITSIHLQNPGLLPLPTFNTYATNNMHPPSTLSSFEEIRRYPAQLEKTLNVSAGILSNLDYVDALFDSVMIGFVSVTGSAMKLEIFYGETISVDFTGLGEMSNYSTQVSNCCGGYKHIYDFRIPHQNNSMSGVTASVATFKAAIANMALQAEELPVIESGSFIQTPFILKTNDDIIRKELFNMIKHFKANVAVRKVVINTDPKTGLSQSVTNLSIIERKGV